MTPLAPHVTAFLRERLPLQRGASEHTCDSYAHAYRLLFEFASAHFTVTPSDLQLEQIDADLVMAFLEHLESTRKNGVATRNARLSASKSFFRFVEHRVPAALDQSRRIRAIPLKKTMTPLVTHLSMEEMQAVLNAPAVTTRLGIRDRAMIHLCFSGGLRVSDLVTLPLAALVLHHQPSVRVMGKGRKERRLPLWKQTAADLRAWLTVRGDVDAREAFLNARDGPMTPSGFEHVFRKHARTAGERCPSLVAKNVSPHCLRHTCAMMILAATGDIRKVALWLGHEDMQTTQIYLRADPAEKLEAINAVVPPSLKRTRFRPPDKLIAALRGDRLSGVI